MTLAASVERWSEHPLARALVESAARRGFSPVEASEFASASGKGVRAMVHGREVRVGSRKYQETLGREAAPLVGIATQLEAGGRTVLWASAGGRPLGFIAVSDKVKEGAAEAVARMRDAGIEIVLLTGDNRQTAGAVAREVGVERVVAEVLPADKAAEVERLQRAGAGPVAMVGDGINDAPALARSDVGIALGTGTDVAMEAADVTLMRGDVRSVPQAIDLSRATMRIIRQNLFWAFAYNVVLIPLAAGVLHPLGWAPAALRELHPISAAVAMALSSVTVVMNSLRLRRVRLDGSPRR
jgi:Cu+-exporting ATPase